VITADVTQRQCINAIATSDVAHWCEQYAGQRKWRAFSDLHVTLLSI